MGQTLEGHDLVLVAGSSVFPYYPYIPGPPLAEGTELVAITRDPDEAARAPVGDAIVADPRLTLEALVDAVAAEGTRPAPEPQPAPGPPEETDPIGAGAVHSLLAEVLPEDAIVVLESPSSTLALRTRLRISRPGSYFFGAGGGLGFGLAAAIGVQLAQPDRPVVCVLGEGSAQYAVTGFWTAAAYGVPVTFLVLNNGEYSILKWFAGMEQVEGAPGLDLPALDTAAVAAAYGVPSCRVEEPEELRERADPGAGVRRARVGGGPHLARGWRCSSSRVHRSSRPHHNAALLLLTLSVPSRRGWPGRARARRGPAARRSARRRRPRSPSCKTTLALRAPRSQGQPLPRQPARHRGRSGSSTAACSAGAWPATRAWTASTCTPRSAPSRGPTPPPASAPRCAPRPRSRPRASPRQCRVYAPLYRQVTQPAFPNPAANTKAARNRAYADVRTAFREYLANDNEGRGRSC